MNRKSVSALSRSRAAAHHLPAADGEGELPAQNVLTVHQNLVDDYGLVGVVANLQHSHTILVNLPTQNTQVGRRARTPVSLTGVIIHFTADVDEAAQDGYDNEREDEDYRQNDNILARSLTARRHKKLFTHESI